MVQSHQFFKESYVGIAWPFLTIIHVPNWKYMIASEASLFFRIWRWKHAILLSVLLVNIFVGTISPRVGSSMLVILYDDLINDDLYRQVGNWRKYFFLIQNNYFCADFYTLYQYKLRISNQCICGKHDFLWGKNKRWDEDCLNPNKWM